MDRSPRRSRSAAGFVRQAQLIPAILPWSASTLARMVRAGKFPAPVKLSPRINAWRREDVQMWLDARQGGAIEGNGVTE